MTESNPQPEFNNLANRLSRQSEARDTAASRETEQYLDLISRLRDIAVHNIEQHDYPDELAPNAHVGIYSVSRINEAGDETEEDVPIWSHGYSHPYGISPSNELFMMYADRTHPVSWEPTAETLDLSLRNVIEALHYLSTDLVPATDNPLPKDYPIEEVRGIFPFTPEVKAEKSPKRRSRRQA